MKFRQLSAVIFSGLFILFLCGCTAAAPRIEGISWEVFRIRSTETGRVREDLSVFVRADDADGNSDLEELYLAHPESRLFWRLFSETWEERTRGNATWIGSSGFTGIDGVPRGEYVLVLLDRAGERAEERLYIDLSPLDTDASEYTYPRLVSQGRSFMIEASGEGPYYILGQDAEGRVRVSAETGAGIFDPGEYRKNGQDPELNWYILMYDPGGWYAGSGPY